MKRTAQRPARLALWFLAACVAMPQAVSAGRGAAKDPGPGVEGLTSTERKVLALIAELKTTKEIASVLCVSPRTVDHHRANIATKLELHGSHALTRFAIEHGSALNDA